MKNNICQVCKGEFDDSNTYEYRGFLFCGEHFDQGIERVDHKRQEVMEVTERSVRSQSDGEWKNGGYKTMRVDVTGRPLSSKQIKEPQILKDYEQGKL